MLSGAGDEDGGQKRRNRTRLGDCLFLSFYAIVLAVKACARKIRARERASRGPDGCAAMALPPESGNPAREDPENDDVEP